MIAYSNSVGRKLLSGSALRVFGLFASAITSLFLMPFIVHHLGDRTYGFWSLAAAFIGYYSLLDLGLSSAVSQYLCIAIGRNDHDECGAVFNTALRIQSLFGGIALLVTAGIIAATPWLCHNPADVHLFREAIAILGIAVAIGFPAKVYSGVLDAGLRFDIQSALGILGLALRTGLVVLAILAGGALLALAWVTLIATLPVTALQIYFARREASWARIEGTPIDIRRAKSLFAYGSYTFLACIGDTLRFQIDPIVISGMIGLAAVTHYRVAGIFAQYYLQGLIASVGMLQPVFSRLYGAGNHPGVERAFFFATKLACCISVFVCLAVSAWGRPFIKCWMGTRYDDAYLPLIVLSLAVFLDVSQKPSVDLLFATFNHRVYAYMNWAEGIINLAFSLALARPLGILGVALGTLIGAVLIRLAVQPWWVCRLTGIQYAGYMKVFGGNVVRCSCLATAGITIAAWGLRPNYLWLVSSGLLATGIYSGFSWLLVFNRQERERLLGALREGKKQKRPKVGTAVSDVAPGVVNP